MKKLIYLFLIFFWNIHYSQTISSFGSISDLVLTKDNVITPSATDTLKGHLMNYHFIKDTVKTLSVFNAKSKLNDLSVFLVGNKFGGEHKVIYGKVGSAVITNKGIFDYSDTLKVGTGAGAKIITYGKHDKSKGNFVYLPKSTDKTLLIPEFLVFKRNLTKREKQQVETYLSIKYGVSINYISEKNYLSSSGQILWDYKKNKKYGYRITGLGRDDAFGLYQKQSQNVNSNIITVALKDVKVLNSQNTGTLSNEEFLLWGDNNEDIEFKEADLLSFHPNKDLKRLWIAQVKTEDTLKTSLYFNLKDVTVGTHIPKLKIYRTTENYENEIFELFEGQKLNDSTYVYKNILWDSDHSNFDYFTLNNDSSNDDISIVSNCNELANGVVKIQLPVGFSSVNYKLIDLKTGATALEIQNSASNPIILNNLLPSQYQILIKKGSDPYIVRNFDIQDISNQNIEDNYLWEGEPIDLDLNFDSYQYTLVSPDGSVTSTAPYVLNGLGEYTLNTTNKLGCALAKKLYVLNQADYTAKNSNSAFKEIKLFPNPSHDGNVNVKIVLKSPKNVKIQIYNALGRLIKEAAYENTANVNALLSIPAIPGYYNVKIFIPEESKGYNLIIN